MHLLMHFKHALAHHNGITAHRYKTGFDLSIGGGMNNAWPSHFHALVNVAVAV